MPRTSPRPASVDWRGVRVLVLVMLIAVSLVAPLASFGASPSRTFVLQDSFSRTVQHGWSTPRSGTYRYLRGTGGMSVDRGTGQVILRAGVTRAVEMTGIDLRDVDLRYRFGLDRLPTGQGVTISAVLRKDSAGNQYRTRLRLTREGAVWLSIVRVRRGVSVRVGQERRVAGVRVVPGRSDWLRVGIRGVAPPRIDARGWRAGARQPPRGARWRVDRRGGYPGRGGVGQKQAGPGQAPPHPPPRHRH
ncbi:MAG: hypothetical protein LH650_15630, partial [Chloroflexi bacterium]|nr:hypothetical protein [Chloroflexota bacterium]